VIVLPLFAAVVLIASVALLRRRQGAVVEISTLALPVVATFACVLAAVMAFPALVGIGGPFFPMALATSAFLAIAPALAPTGICALVASVTIGLTAILTLADVVYWRFFGGLMPLLAIGNASHIGDVADSIGALLMAQDLALLPLFVIAVLLPWMLPRPVSTTPSLFARRARALLLVATVAGGGIPVVADVHLWLEHRESWKVFRWTMSLSGVGLVGAHARDIARSAREIVQRRTPSADELEAWVGFADARARVVDDESTALDDAGTARGMNLLIVQVEAMQGFAVDAKVGDDMVMPFLNVLRRTRALYYPNLWDQTGGSPTSDCEYLVLNGLHPLAQGSVAFRRPGNDFVALPKVLGEAGYATLSAHAFDKGMWNRALLHPRVGFDTSFFKDSFAPGRDIGWGLGDIDFFKQSVAKMTELEEPFFAFLITLTSHHPYKYIPRDLRELKLRNLGDDVLGQYLHSMRYVDDALRSLFDELGRAGLADRTVVAIYGDHDSKLTLSARVQKNAERELGLDPRIVDDLARRAWRTKQIPLFVVIPGQSEGRVVDDVGGQIDIAPTLLHHLGVAKPRSMLGRPLLGVPGTVGRRFAARYDGAGVDAMHVLDVESGELECYLRETGASIDVKSCAHLQREVQEEIAISERITLEDLAAYVSHATVPKTGAERAFPPRPVLDVPRPMPPEVR
jgi:phosphoglycerol transferase MdoB-like AlkP superfamily enzyme